MFARWLFGFTAFGCSLSLFAAQDSTIAEKQWRNHPMAIEDNSFLLEEAFNQSSGVIQYTAINQFNRGIAEVNFECEMPLKGELHQLSISIPTKVFHSTPRIEDIVVSYRPLLLGRNRWLIASPRFSIIFPAGKFSHSVGGGTWGVEWNVALTKQLSRKLISHVNLGSSYPIRNIRAETNQNRLHNQFAGTSLIFAAAKGFDLMAEVTASKESIGSSKTSAWSLIGNPGFRFCIRVNEFVLVPGMSTPLALVSGKPVLSQVLLYISIERVQ